MEKFKKIIFFLKEAIFPSFCLNCKKKTYHQLPWLRSGWFCLQCQREFRSSWKTICPICNKEVSFRESKYCSHPPSWLENISYIFVYEDLVIKEMIHALKYNFITDLVKEFEPFIYKEKMNFYRMPVDVIIPLPLHKNKLRYRGFNQADLIANEVSRVLKKPILKDVLIKNRTTTAQMNIKRPSQRQKNIKGVFSVVGPEKIEYQNVLLVDDVTTTGATLEEAAQTLRQAGALKVYSFVLARD